MQSEELSAKTVYLVRHGETPGNLGRRHQHPNTGLTERGEKQAEVVARYFKEIKPTHIITSTNLRAVLTARTIATHLDLIPETHRDFEELRRPDYIIGRKLISISTISYLLIWYFFNSLEGNGETYEEMLERINRARDHIEALPNGARVVVVSHSVFINLFLAHLCRPRKLGLFSGLTCFWKILKIKNCSVITVSNLSQGRSKKCDWLITDHISQPE